MGSDKVGIIRGIIVAVAILLIGQAARLQIFSGTYAREASATTTSRSTLYPSRGLILDRNNRLLTTNDPVYDLMVVYNQVDDSMDVAAFTELLGIDRETFDERLHRDFRSVRYARHIPFVFYDKVDIPTHARLEEHLHRFPGFFFQVRDVRKYPYRTGAHVLGYIREVNREEVEADGPYRPGDYIGGTGLERRYESSLRGEKGVRYVLRDRRGNELDSYDDGSRDQLPVSGTNIQTGLDAELQRYGEQLMQQKIGGIVAIEPKTGEILSLVSSPGYDPNDMTITRERGNIAARLSVDSLKPFFNRALSAQYPPGSIFKPIIALIAQQEGIRRPYSTIPCPGYYRYNDLTVRCRNHPGPNTLPNSLQWSCNTYYVKTFRDIVDKKSFSEPKVGYSTFVNYLYRFGLGNPLGIDFPTETDGNVPTINYYDKLYPAKLGGWRSPTIISLGIGQGELQMTTLQMANVAAIMANRGWFIPPHLIRAYEDGRPLEEPYRTRKNVGVEQQHFEPVIQGMLDVVEQGTGRRALIPNGPRVAGKTGTVQNPHGEDHSTFIAFAPADNPRIAIAVYVENAGGGGRFAAPIAGLMLEKYLTGSISELSQYKEKIVLETDLISVE